MPTTTENLSGGLVTARDPSLLAPGELQQTDDLFYKPGSPSLNKSPGRSRFNGATLTGNAEGLAYCGFDGADDQLVALRGPVSGNRSLVTSDVGVSGTFSTLLSSVSGTTLESIHYNNRHVLLTGGVNKVLLSNGTVRQHGMQPVKDTPACTVVTSGGTWPVDSGGLPKYYEYWTTEVYKNSTEDVEGTFVGVPATVYILNSTYYVTVNRPPIVNPTATHWRVYRSIAKSLATTVAFPNGFLIGELPMSSNSFNDGLATPSSKDFPSAVSDGAPYSLDAFTFAPWATSSNLTASDAAYAVGTSILTSTPDGYVGQMAMAVTSGFTLASIGSPITDISVEVKGYHSSASGRVSAQLSWDGGLSWTPTQSVYLGTNSGAPVTVSMSGLWGRTWTASEFSSSVFRVALLAYHTVAGTVTHNVDYVAVTVTHSGTTGSQAVAFRDIQISLGGVATRIGAAGAPSIATTGDIFQDSLVLNDVANPTQVTYSMPGDIDAFPAVYLLKTDTKDKDSVTNIKSLGSVCLVGLASQVWRVNYLPREEDAEFDRGRCIEVVDTDHGMAGTHAACKFTLNGQTMVGYISSSGPRMTNGFQALTMTDDLNWEAMVNVSALSRCILVNDARYHHLRMYYAPSSSNNLSRCLFFSYHPTHLKDGKLKVSGPQHVNVLAATSGVSGSDKVLYTSDNTGFVYTENQGSQDDSGVGIAPILRTREMYQAGPGNEWQLQQVFIHHQSEGGGTYNVSYEVAKTNTNVRATGPKPFTMIRRGLSNISSNESGEGISIKIAGTDDNLPASLDYLVLEGTNMGVSDPLTR